ncbi:MAG: hydrolase [Bacteroidales bacterium]|nr:hydrolase [Bacteroidales bacterium]
MNRLLSLLLITLSAMAASAGSIKWHSADSLPLLGKAVDDASTSSRFQRLPDSLEHKVKRPVLFGLGRHSAGMAIRFTSDSPEIHARWKSRFKSIMDHMTPTGTRGLDLYVMLPDSSWTFAQTARPDLASHTTETCVISNMPAGQHEYLLYLSLYDAVDSLYIGVPREYSLTAPAINHPRAEAPIVYYGTSLVHGGCVNRPGMAHTNILRRRLDRDVINLGFGGNGQLDLEIADVIAAVKDPSLVILDFVPNCSSAQIDTLMIPFVDKIRAAHPSVPILFVECLPHPRCRFDNVMKAAVERHNAMMRRRYDDLTERYDHLYYMPTADIFGDDNEHTVDALHLTDMGALRFADAMEPVIREILAKE